MCRLDKVNVIDTVQSVLKANCIKQSFVLRGHIFKSLKSQTDVYVPVLSKQLS